MCGIFGIITPKPRKLDKRAFCVLGVDNDSRGGDSCGIFIDKKYEYGVAGDKLFYNFFPKSKLLESTNKAQIALGHCRRASVGAINEANAQPVVIKNAEGKVEFALIHNGTIINYLELAKKYIPNIDVKDMTDSQVMANIFYHAGYDVLGEYIGAGAFVIADYRYEEPRVFIFKGESKLYSYSQVTQVERPLFCSYSSTEFVFSSIVDFLKALRQGREVHTISPNKLLVLYNGELKIVAEYDRKSLWQQSSRTGSYYDKDSLNVSNSTYSKKTQEANTIFNNNWGDAYFNDAVDLDPHGIYWLGNDWAHGILCVDSMGNIVKKGGKDVSFTAAFWKGVLLKNSQCFYYLSRYCKELEVSHEELLSLFPDLIHYLSPVPCWINSRGVWVVSDTPDTNFRFSGSVIFPFSTEKVYFSNGDLVNYVDGIPYSKSIQTLLEYRDYVLSRDTNIVI